MPVTMQQKFMYEDILRLRRRIQKNPKHSMTMEFWYIEGVLIDMKNTFGTMDVTKEWMRTLYGNTFFDIWSRYS